MLQRMSQYALFLKITQRTGRLLGSLVSYARFSCGHYSVTRIACGSRSCLQ